MSMFNTASTLRLSLPDFPSEILRSIALSIYDPLELTQQDRLTWGIFSTVDMHEERQHSLQALIALGMTCRKIRREVLGILFTCVRIYSVNDAEEMISNKCSWGRHVRSMIIDLSMFDIDIQRHEQSRSCWEESALLISLLTSLPRLEHLSLFADASDDSTISLLTAALIPRSPYLPALESLESGVCSHTPKDLCDPIHIPFYRRLKSFGWRQRAAPPDGFCDFSQASVFVSILHMIRRAPNVSFLVLDADVDTTTRADIMRVMRELAERDDLEGQETTVPLSLMICGPIQGWGTDFLDDMVDTFCNIKELFIDRPLNKASTPPLDSKYFPHILHPLYKLIDLTLLQIGSYRVSQRHQIPVALVLSKNLLSLRVLGLLGADGETVWLGIWKGDLWTKKWGSMGSDSHERGFECLGNDLGIGPLEDGDLAILDVSPLSVAKDEVRSPGRVIASL